MIEGNKIELASIKRFMAVSSWGEKLKLQYRKYLIELKNLVNLPAKLTKKDKSLTKVIRKAIKSQIVCLCPCCKQTSKKGKVEVSRWPDTLVLLLEKQRQVADVTVCIDRVVKIPLIPF